MTMAWSSNQTHANNSGNFTTSPHGFQRAIKKRTPIPIHYIYRILFFDSRTPVRVLLQRNGRSIIRSFGSNPKLASVQ